MNRTLVRRVLLPVHEQIIGRHTFAVARQLEASQWQSAAELRAMQLAKLNDLLAMALRQTQYGRLMDVDSGWRASNLEDLGSLPMMDKSFISRHREELVNRGVVGGAISYRTGGSTGVPLIFYIDRRRQSWDRAIRIRTHRWWGIEPGDREVQIWNSPVELSGHDRIKKFRDWLTNEFLLPASELSHSSISAYVRRLRRFGPDCLFGYPSAMSLLARLACRANLDLSGLAVRVIFSTAEVLHDHQRALLSSVFGNVPVADGYGSREAGFIAHQCPHGRMHVTSENVIVEFIKDGRTAAADEDAEMVVTQLDNHAMPFIRYRTGDIGQYSEELCPCGRQLPVIRMLKGRSNDMLVTVDGRWIHSSAIHAALSDIPGIANYQFCQEGDLSVRMLLVCDEQFPGDGVERLHKRLMSRLGRDGRLTIERCDSIASLASGKHCYVVSEVGRRQLSDLSSDVGQR